jgi:glycosyltransferase involved in cell wall biosynthesis
MKSISFFFRHPNDIYFSIEKLFHAVAKELSKQPDWNAWIREINLPFKSKLSTIRKNISFIGQSQSQINHITGDIHYGILGCSKKNINILTIHDCVLLRHYPKTNPRYWVIRWLWYQLPVRKADVVTVISENTKKDLLFFTKCSADKIRIIPNFIDPLFMPRPKSFTKHNPKLLFIGSTANKNLERAIEAVEGLGAVMIIVGYLSEKQVDELKRRNIPYRLLNKLSDGEMRDIYAEADILLFPSTYEGFGLPIIEAQATGRPVVTSKLEPMASVSGNAASLVDPYNVESIRKGIKRIIEDEAFRDELIVRGFKNVERFQIKKITQQYIDLYLELLEKKGV